MVMSLRAQLTGAEVYSSSKAVPSPPTDKSGNRCCSPFAYYRDPLFWARSVQSLRSLRQPWPDLDDPQLVAILVLSPTSTTGIFEAVDTLIVERRAPARRSGNSTSTAPQRITAKLDGAPGSYKIQTTRFRPERLKLKWLRWRTKPKGLWSTGR